jgi:hypothetical protein
MTTALPAPPWTIDDVLAALRTVVDDAARWVADRAKSTFVAPLAVTGG